MDDDSEKRLRQLKDQHVSMMFNASQSYDKAILTLSTALLGFAFAFVKLGEIHCTRVLIFSWISLIISIISILLSFMIVQIHAENRLRTLNSPSKNNNHWSDFTMDLLQWTAGLFFLIGLIGFTVFVGMNIDIAHFNIVYNINPQFCPIGFINNSI